MSDDAGGCFWIVVAAAAIGYWLIWGDGMATVRQWTGSATYEDQLNRLSVHAKGNRVGDATDVWLIKHTIAGAETNRALFWVHGRLCRMQGIR